MVALLISRGQNEAWPAFGEGGIYCGGMTQAVRSAEVGSRDRARGLVARVCKGRRNVSLKLPAGHIAGNGQKM